MKRSFFSVILSLIFISGCSLTPEYARPKVDLPERIGGDVKGIERDWWKGFGDETLNALIREAVKNNDDLKLATARIEEAMARLDLAGSNLYPTAFLKSEVSREETSSEISKNPFSGTSNNFIVSLPVSYEIDLWKKIRNRRDAALSTLLATRAAMDTIQISLISNVITTYFNIVSIRLQIETTEEILKRYREIYEFRLKQFKHGLVDEIVPQQAKAEYESTRVILETLKEEEKILLSSLSLLLGREPKEIFTSDYSPSGDLPHPIPIPSLLPSELLNQRPDIVKAEEELKAANLEIGVARAAYFPDISLTGFMGIQSDELKNLFQSSAGIWSIGANLTTPLIDANRIRSNIRITEARQKQAVIIYVRTVKTAFKEVYDALNRLERVRARLEAQQEALKALEDLLSLATRRYERGLTEYITVLDAQRGYLNARLRLISLKTELLNNQITLYKALGGGWEKSLLEERQDGKDKKDHN